MDPSHKALTGKIRQAIKAMEAGSIAFIQQDVIAADLLEVGCEIDKIPDLLLELLTDITPSQYVDTVLVKPKLLESLDRTFSQISGLQR